MVLEIWFVNARDRHAPEPGLDSVSVCVRQGGREGGRGREIERERA